MKKISIIIVFIIITMFGNVNVFAYSTSDYSIDIPSGYDDVSENSFTNAEGRNINVQIVPFNDEGADDPYTEERLNEIVQELYTEMDNYREELRTKLRKENDSYNIGLTEDEIEEYAKSFKCDSIEKKEVTTFSKNEYKGFHITAKYSMGEDISYYADQYIVASGNDIYTLTITSPTLSEVDSSTNKSVVDSFTIINFKELKSASKKFGNESIIIVIIAIISSVTGALIGLKQKIKKKNK